MIGSIWDPFGAPGTRSLVRSLLRDSSMINLFYIELESLYNYSLAAFWLMVPQF